MVEASAGVMAGASAGTSARAIRPPMAARDLEGGAADSVGTAREADSTPADVASETEVASGATGAEDSGIGEVASEEGEALVGIGVEVLETEAEEEVDSEETEDLEATGAEASGIEEVVMVVEAVSGVGAGLGDVGALVDVVILVRKTSLVVEDLEEISMLRLQVPV